MRAVRSRRGLRTTREAVIMTINGRSSSIEAQMAAADKVRVRVKIDRATLDWAVKAAAPGESAEQILERAKGLRDGLIALYADSLLDTNAL